jgi:hypothetical protein
MEMVKTILTGELVDASLTFKYVNLDNNSDITSYWKNIYSKKTDDEGKNIKKSYVDCYMMRV